MFLTFACVMLSGIGAAAYTATAATTSIELKPAAITFEAPPTVDTSRSCVLRCRTGTMNILSVTASDPAIVVDVQDNRHAGTYIVAATVPSGYPITAGREPVYLQVQTDLPNEPHIRIPINVWVERKPDHDVWLKQAKKIIGKPMPTVNMDRLGGGKVDIGPVEGKITAVVFSAHWCGHCDNHMPVIEEVWKEYTKRDVQFLGVAIGTGNGQGIEDAAKRWGVDWPIGVDWNIQVIHQFGVKAFPTVFLVSRDGIVEAIHGRWANRPTDNGLDHLDMQLRSELEILLAGGTRKDFPDWEKVLQRPVTLKPTSPRENQPVLKIEREVREASSKASETMIAKVAIRNMGLKPLKIGKVTIPEGMVIKPQLFDSVSPGGVVVACCQAANPVKRQLSVLLNDNYSSLFPIPNWWW